APQPPARRVGGGDDAQPRGRPHLVDLATRRLRLVARPAGADTRSLARSGGQLARMTATVQIAAVLVSLGLLLLVLELVRSQKLSEEHSLLWIFCALALLLL